MPAGEVVAVKVLDSGSKQGEKEFHTEVMATVLNILFEERYLAKIQIIPFNSCTALPVSFVF